MSTVSSIRTEQCVIRRIPAATVRFLPQPIEQGFVLELPIVEGGRQSHCHAQSWIEQRERQLGRKVWTRGDFSPNLLESAQLVAMRRTSQPPILKVLRHGPPNTATLRELIPRYIEAAPTLPNITVAVECGAII